jgi:uncharacterized protein involved in exopolysaccharide biosynthesis
MSGTQAATAWTPALRQTLDLTWRWRVRLALVVALGAGLGAAARGAWPESYAATEQLLFDPQGLKLFDGDSGPTRLDANAQIDYVESQMGVLTSERVLTRLAARECDPARPPPPPGFAALCGQGARLLDALRAALSVRRAERSFLVDVTATAATPEFAARLAADHVAAYVAEDSAARAANAARLGAALDARIAGLKQELSESETRAQAYRSEESLTRIGDKLVVELKLADATAGLNAAQTRLALAQARLKQLDATPDAAGLGALGDEAETRPLAALMERRAAARADLAPLASRLGARNPELIQAQSRLAAVERDVAREIAAIRAAARAERARAAHERDAFAAAADALTAELNRARAAGIALAALDQSAAAHRKLIDELESRAREIAEAGRLDLANLRVASEARAPAARALWRRLALGGAVGAALAGLLALAGLAAWAGLAPRPEVESLRAAARRLRAEAA